MNSSLIWHHFYPYQSVSFCQSFLKHCYERQHVMEPTANSYKNGYPLCYYLEHGKQYYLQAEQAPYEIKPVLIFYGTVQLLKACLLTVDPEYPENAQVLAHGVSSRKRKKQSYSFVDDSVRTQRYGLLPYFAEKMFHMKHLDGYKFTMGDLLKRLPDLSSLFKRLTKKASHFQLYPIGEGAYTAPSDILDALHMTKERFTTLLKTHGCRLQPGQLKDETLIITIEKESCPFYPSLFHYGLDDKRYIPREKHTGITLPEPLVHYLILYNLSMISRYETEWWYDLHFQRVSTDLSFIKSFMDVTSIKFPWLINHYFKELEEL